MAMEEYTYIAFSAEGAQVHGELTAAGPAEVEAEVTRKGMLFVSCRIKERQLPEAPLAPAAPAPAAPAPTAPTPAMPGMPPPAPLSSPAGTSSQARTAPPFRRVLEALGRLETQILAELSKAGPPDSGKMTLPSWLKTRLAIRTIAGLLGLGILFNVWPSIGGGRSSPPLERVTITGEEIKLPAGGPSAVYPESRTFKVAHVKPEAARLALSFLLSRQKPPAHAVANPGANSLLVYGNSAIFAKVEEALAVIDGPIDETDVGRQGMALFVRLNKFYSQRVAPKAVSKPSTEMGDRFFDESLPD